MTSPSTLLCTIQRTPLAHVNRRDLIVLGALAISGAALSLGVAGPAAVVMVVIGCALAWWSPPAATAAVLCAVPWIYHPVSLPGGRFSLLELGLVVASIGFGAGLATALLRPSERGEFLRLLLPVWMTVAALMLLTVATISLFTVADPDHLTESLRDFRTVIAEPVAALILVRFAVRQGRLPLLVGALLLTAVAVAVAALVGVVTSSDIVSADNVIRARGPYPHPNNLGLYLERMGVFAAGVAIADRSWRPIALPAAVVILGGVALTLSRGAGLAVLAGVAVVLLLAGERRGWRWFIVGAVVLLVGFGAAAGGRLLDLGSGGTESTRELIWRSSLRMVRDYPISGIGLDQFLYLYEQRYVAPAGWPERYTSHPHNLLLDVWLRLGILGPIVFVWLGLGVVRMVRRASGALPTPGRAVSIGAAGALVAGLTHGLLDNGYFLPDLAVLTWVFIALIEPPKPDSNPVMPRLWRFWSRWPRQSAIAPANADRSW